MSDLQDSDLNKRIVPDYGRAIRWFGAEFLVVVTGVLVALAATSWWDTRQLLERESAYLRQLAADIEQTYLDLDAADETMLPGDLAGAQLVQSFRTPDPPPRDSVYRWIVPAFDWEGESAHLVVSTAEALVATGDLTLIRSESLRVAIVQYLKAAEQSVERSRSDFEFHRIAIQAALKRLDFVEALVLTTPGARIFDTEFEQALSLIPSELGPDPFPLDVSAMRADQETYRGLVTMHVMRLNERDRRATIREDAGDLARALEAYLDTL